MDRATHDGNSTGIAGAVGCGHSETRIDTAKDGKGIVVMIAAEKTHFLSPFVLGALGPLA
jgi:hypothetical protein